MKRILTLATLLALVTFWSPNARADVLAHIDLSEQRLHLYVDGEKKHTWKVSTGKKHGWTHTGSIYWMQRYLADSYYIVTISNYNGPGSVAPVVRSIGYINMPVQVVDSSQSMMEDICPLS